MPAQGNFKRDFLYVKDAVASYIAMFEGLTRKEVQGEAFNFAMGGSWTVMEIVQTIQKLMRCEHIKPEIIPQTHGEIFHQHVSINKAKRMLGWMPRYSLEAGLVETIQWYTDLLQAANDAPSQKTIAPDLDPTSAQAISAARSGIAPAALNEISSDLEPV